MVIPKLCYVLLVCAAVLFFILYKDMLSLILLLLALLMPILLFLMLQRMKHATSLFLTAESSVQSKYAPVRFTITLRNRSMLPIPYAMVLLSYRNAFSHLEETMTVAMPVPPHNAQSITIPVSSDYCGQIRVTARELILLDYLRLFRARRYGNASAEVLVLPQTWPVDVVLTAASPEDTESNTFSKSKPGDDASEVFGYRTYQPGDKINRMHWKLSSKLDNLMIKEYSLPICDSVCMLLDWSGNSANLLDTMVETLFSISDALVSLESTHSIAWYQEEARLLCTETVTTQEDLSVTIGRLFRTKAGHTPGMALRSLDGETAVSHLLYLTTGMEQTQIQLLQEHAAHRKTVLLILDEADATQTLPVCDDTITIVPIQAGHITQAVQELYL